MALVTPNLGDTLMLGYIANQNPTLRLYTNDLVPDQNTTIGMVTECDIPGYAPIALPGTGWSINSISGIATASFTPQLFIFTANTVPTNVYGYYITDSTPRILWIERFTNGPYIMIIPGGQITIGPIISMRTDPS